jgi:hypothetical protein
MVSRFQVRLHAYVLMDDLRNADLLCWQPRIDSRAPLRNIRANKKSSPRQTPLL